MMLPISILPSGQDESDLCRINNQQTNALIKRFDGHLNVKYIDVQEFFVDDEGFEICDYYCPGDIVHISSKGYWMLWRQISSFLTIKDYGDDIPK